MSNSNCAKTWSEHLAIDMQSAITSAKVMFSYAFLHRITQKLL